MAKKQKVDFGVHMVRVLSLQISIMAVWATVFAFAVVLA